MGFGIVIVFVLNSVFYFNFLWSYNMPYFVDLALKFLITHCWLDLPYPPQEGFFILVSLKHSQSTVYKNVFKVYFLPKKFLGSKPI